MLKNSIEYKRFVWELNNIIDIDTKDKQIIFLCIGTDRIIGDSFGPKVGSTLKKQLYHFKSVKVIGDLANAMTYNEIQFCTRYIKQKYKNSLIIAIDAALSDKSNIGKIFIQNRGLRYAESLGKKNNIIGNISIKGVVGEDVNNSIGNFRNLKQASNEKIQSMTNIVSSGIIEVMNKKENNGKNIYK